MLVFPLSDAKDLDKYVFLTRLGSPSANILQNYISNPKSLSKDVQIYLARALLSGWILPSINALTSLVFPSLKRSTILLPTMTPSQ